MPRGSGRRSGRAGWPGCAGWLCGLALMVWVTGYPGSCCRRRRSQPPSAGGTTMAATIASAVSMASISLSGLLGATLTTCPFTATGPVGAMVGVTPVVGTGPTPVGEDASLEPGEGDDEVPAPGVVALPLTTMQFSGSPTLSHGDGWGACSSSVSLPLVNVGLLQPASVVRFGPGMAPGILSLCSSPPWTR